MSLKNADPTPIHDTKKSSGEGATQTKPAPSTRAIPYSSPRQMLGGPRKIFLGWTALVFVAGFGYYTVKTRNDVKRKLLMETEAEEARRATGTPEGAYAAGASSRRRAAEESKQQSPLSALAGAFNRQTTQRDRT